MAFFDGDMRPAVKKWSWREKRVFNPFRKCERSGKSLFLRKAYYGMLFLDWEYHHDIWLSPQEYMLKVLRDD